MSATDGRGIVSKVMSRWGWLSALMIVAGLAGAGLTSLQTTRELRLSWFGITAKGLVVDLQEQRMPCDLSRTGLSGNGSCMVRTAKVRFEAGGQTQMAQVDVSSAMQTPQIGEQVDLHYLTDDPTVVSLDQGRAYNWLFLFAFVAVVIIAKGVQGLHKRMQMARITESSDGE